MEMLEYTHVNELVCKESPADVLTDVAKDLDELELVASAVAEMGEENTLIKPALLWHIAGHLHVMAEAVAYVVEAMDGGSLATATRTEAQK